MSQPKVSRFMEKLLDGVEVEWKALGDVAEIYGGLTGKNKSDFNNGSAKYVTYMNIFNNIHIDPALLEKVKVGDNERQHKVKYGDVLFTGSSEIAIEAGMSAAVTIDFKEPVYLNSFSFGVRFNDDVKLTPDFSKYLFRSEFMRSEISKTANGVTRFNVSKARFKKILVPIPCPDNPEKSLEIQAEIVRILDAFTAMTAELTAELNLRQQQYNHYRDQLLSFEDGEVEWKTLGEIAEYSKKRVSSEVLDESNYVGVNNLLQNRAGKTESDHVPTEGNSTGYSYNDILIGNIRPYLKKIWHADRDGGTNGDVLVVHLTDSAVIPRYLYQVLADDKFFEYNMQHAKGAKMPRGSKPKILEYLVPIPSKKEQARIVAILDKFDTLTTSITEGLPREIELRQRQYEYYRDFLLSFPKSDTEAA